MPNIITHILFTDDVYEKLDDPKYDFLESRLQLMEVGGNGPDFLFFQNYNPTSFMKKTPLRKIGNEVHSHSINDFYASAVASIQKEKDPEIRQDMMTYTCGHLCHWALDSIAHPYVFYRTGCCTGKSSWWHHRFESLIDAIMLKVKNDCTISDFKAYETCEVSLEQARAIARIYVPAIRNVYKVDVLPHQILESLNDWCFVEKLFYDKTGTKFKISHSFEKVLRTESMISGFFVPDEPEDPFDTINLLHKEWVHPCDDTIKSTESFFDLYDRAMLRAVEAIQLFYEACQDPDALQPFLDYLGDRSYDTGLSESKEMKFFDLVY